MNELIRVSVRGSIRCHHMKCNQCAVLLSHYASFLFVLHHYFGPSFFNPNSSLKHSFNLAKSKKFVIYSQFNNIKIEKSRDILIINQKLFLL